MFRKTVLNLTLACTLALAVAGCSQKKMTSLKDGTYTASTTGHNGPLEVKVTVAHGKIKDIDATKNVETKGIGSLAIEKIKNKVIAKQTLNLDTATGATISSAATLRALKDALKEAGLTKEAVDGMPKESINQVLSEKEYQYDVVVIGAGGAGLTAAIQARAKGAKVLVLEKTSQVGGNTLVSGGGINVPGTDLQKKKGITDSVELYKKDTLKGGDNVGNPELVDTLSSKALDAYQWLVKDVKMNFIQDRVQQFGGHSVARAVIPVGNSGYEMMSKLEKLAMDKGVDIFKNTSAKKLMVDDKGVITAVIAENAGKEVRFIAKKAVVLASGGFGSNIAMRKEYNPAYDEKYKTTCISASSGDGINMAKDIGAALVDMKQIQVYPTCNPQTGIISYVANARFDGGILVNQEGKRFVNDMGRRDVISNAILAQPGKYAYLLWGQEVEKNGHMTKMHKNEFENLKKSALLFEANSIEELAEKTKIDVTTLKKTLEAYNGYVKAGSDPEQQRGGKLRTILQGPFYIQKVAPATHHTMGGVKINSKAEVLNKDGKAIQHLFAAGEVAGGVHGTNRLGGNAITDIVVFGRIAGENAAK
ncbi:MULTISPECIES: flavocytochrome c [Terrabacteria group]|uniref:flavocytochrome c n=1 Tax=Bacillati TaxID=1783272 RepID=UPI001C6DDCB0|nr:MULTISPECIES: flavocytochrome c [Terrabacteria group]MBW9212194.1 flavocytochrome c [Trueperella sp. zg.1013]